VSEDLTTELVSTVVVLAAETSLTFINITIASSDTTARVKFLLIIPPPCPETIFRSFPD